MEQVITPNGHHNGVHPPLLPTTPTLIPVTPPVRMPAGARAAELLRRIEGVKRQQDRENERHAEARAELDRQLHVLHLVRDWGRRGLHAAVLEYALTLVDVQPSPERLVRIAPSELRLVAEWAEEVTTQIAVAGLSDRAVLRPQVRDLAFVVRVPIQEDEDRNALIYLIDMFVTGRLALPPFYDPFDEESGE